MKIDQTLLNNVLAIAENAGLEILHIYNTQPALDIKFKHDESPVTLADLSAHNTIVKGLKALTPDIPILSEEDPNFDFETRKSWSTYWLVDPLDGTKEFIGRNGQFTVNIALIQNCLPILGVIYVPLKNMFYYAAKNLGSYKKDPEGNIELLKIREWTPGREIVLVATRRELHEDLQKLLGDYGGVKITYRSSSLKFSLVAEGHADIYLRKKPIQEWDTGAGQCILEQAGGVVLDSNWRALRYNTKPLLLNPPFIALGDSKQLLSILKTMPMF